MADVHRRRNLNKDQSTSTNSFRQKNTYGSSDTRPEPVGRSVSMRMPGDPHGGNYCQVCSSDLNVFKVKQKCKLW